MVDWLTEFDLRWLFFGQTGQSRVNWQRSLDCVWPQAAASVSEKLSALTFWKCGNTVGPVGANYRNASTTCCRIATIPSVVGQQTDRQTDRLSPLLAVSLIQMFFRCFRTTRILPARTSTAPSTPLPPDGHFFSAKAFENGKLSSGGISKFAFWLTVSDFWNFEKRKTSSIVYGIKSFFFLSFPGDTHAAHEATEAMWADNIVLPVYKSGGAAGGDFDFRMDKVFEILQCHLETRSWEGGFGYGIGVCV